MECYLKSQQLQLCKGAFFIMHKMLALARVTHHGTWYLKERATEMTGRVNEDACPHPVVYCLCHLCCAVSLMANLYSF